MRRNKNLWLLCMAIALTLGLTSCFKPNNDQPNYLGLKTMFGKYRGDIYIVKTKNQPRAVEGEEGNPEGVASKKDVFKEYKDMEMEINRTIVVRNLPLDPIFDAIFIKEKDKPGFTLPEKTTTFEATYGYLPGTNVIHVFLNPTPIRFKVKLGEKEEEVSAIIEGIRRNAYIGTFIYPDQYAMGMVVKDIKISGTPISGPINLFYYLKFKKHASPKSPKK
ncbi:Uncharacterised protein [Porphyromonas cangingivalis]|uniref:DUF4840 domain-containing protein n=1 Tax=Porphyromonas cangingivalis TaxID=36874 RepID=UPI000D9F8543|nr:DUF4840 domain-containing protein [Porphyromonas cangingivalis]SPY34293.1 Uncharacterised protein [Porphyromonas cangingivalis]